MTQEKATIHFFGNPASVTAAFQLVSRKPTETSFLYIILKKENIHHSFPKSKSTVSYKKPTLHLAIDPKMENILGLLRIHVKRGVNLAIRDTSSSDPYIVFYSGKQVKYRFCVLRFDSGLFDLFFSCQISNIRHQEQRF